MSGERFVRVCPCHRETVEWRSIRCRTSAEWPVCPVSRAELLGWLIVDLRRSGAVIGLGFPDRPGALFAGFFERRAA